MAKSLYFQFKDGPISIYEEKAKLYEAGLVDPRYMNIWWDVYDEVSYLPK